MKKRVGIMQKSSIKNMQGIGMFFMLTLSFHAFSMDVVHESTLLVHTDSQPRDAKHTIPTNSFGDVYHPRQSAKDLISVENHSRLRPGMPHLEGEDDGLPSSPSITTVVYERFDDQGIEVEGGAAIARTAHQGHERKHFVEQSEQSQKTDTPGSEELEIVLGRLRALLTEPDLSLEDAAEIREKIDFFSKLLHPKEDSQREAAGFVKPVQSFKRPGFMQRLMIQRAARIILRDPSVEIVYSNLTGGTGIQGHPKFCSSVTQALVAQLQAGRLPFELFSVVKNLIDQSEIFKKSISVSGLQVHDALIRDLITHQKDTIRKLISAVIRVMRERKLTTPAMQAVEKLSDEQMAEWQNLDGKDEEVDENDPLYALEPFYDAAEKHDQKIEENDLVIESLFTQLGFAIKDCLDSRGKLLSYQDLSSDVRKKITKMDYISVRTALILLSNPGTDEMIMNAQQQAIETVQKIIARKKSVVIQTVPYNMSLKVIRN